ncbi:MAG: FAD-dependent oxidoreductase [Syntrophomonadaceae bacterium]
MFETLFSPVYINKTQIKNRIVYPSMGVLYSQDGKLNDRYLNYYVEKARGGAGIVTVGPVGIDESAIGYFSPHLDRDEAIESFSILVQAIQAAGAKAWVQLMHAGAYARPEYMGGIQPVAPSPVYSQYSKAQARELTLDEIKAIQRDFVKSAVRAKTAGFDGVEIIGSAGYLICQFLSPLRNQRQDEYGGCFENRIRFAREIIEEMRLELGPDYPITIRVAGNDFIPGSNTDSETPEIARVYEKAGVDAISVTGGWHEAHVPQLTMSVPRGAYLYLAQNIKEAVSIPVIASNRVPEPNLAEKLLRDGQADLINLGRVLMADPFWPEKARSGHSERIVPCVACLQGCMDELMVSRPVQCMVNPRQGYEGVRNIKRTGKPQRVLVIGAGPGGLEAAVRAAEAGHKVELCEKTNRIGGQLWIAGTPPHKQELWRITEYYQEMIKVHDIKVHMNTKVDLGFIQQLRPDYIIAAEGAQPVQPTIEGIEGPGVLNAWDVLESDPPLGRKIAVLGGGAVGLETAHFMAVKGTISEAALHFLFSNNAESPERLKQLIYKGSKQITVFEQLPRVGNGVGRSTIWGLMNELRKHGVRIINRASVQSFNDGLLTYEKDGKLSCEDFDNLVIAVGSRPVRTLADVLPDTGIPFTVIGDSQAPGQISDAIHQAYLAVMNNLQD